MHMPDTVAIEASVLRSVPSRECWKQPMKIGDNTADSRSGPRVRIVAEKEKEKCPEGPLAR